jgi:hypothetical protein
MTNRNPYIYNPVAKSILSSYSESLFENEKMEPLLSKICDQVLNIFKILIFDLAKKRDRNPDVVRDKLSDLSKSKSVKSLTGKILDYANDSDVSDSGFSEVKRLYIESLKKFTDSLNRASEISKGKSDSLILKKFKIDPMKIQTSLDSIAKQAEEEEEKMLKSEEDSLNESIFIGYSGRIKNLKKLLSNLITSSEGKDSGRGYGRDWKRTFIELDQRRKSLDIYGSGEKNRKMLEDLEKQVEKYQDEFNKALVSASNKALQGLEADDELYSSYLDVADLNRQALDDLTRAQAQYSIAIKDIKDGHESRENEISKSLFPIKKGDSDSDSKFKDSGLVFAIQTAICNGIPSAGKLIKSKKGLNGKFGPSTQAVIMTIQKTAGNKNSNGEIDRSLLDAMLSSDWISNRDKFNIRKAVDKIKSPINESKKWDKDLSNEELYEEKIFINNSEFEKELETQYKSAIGASGSPDQNLEDVETDSEKTTGVESLAKKLRSRYSLKIEGDDFLKGDGSLKSSYTSDFISAWNRAIDNVNPEDEYSYFYTAGGVYNINLSTSSIKTPCNWKKWADVRKMDSLSDEDCLDFISNYMNGWRTFGLIRPEWRYSGIRDLNKKIPESVKASKSYQTVYSACVENGSIPFVSYKLLKGAISQSLKSVLQSDEKSPDLDDKDFSLLNNFLIMLCNCITFDGEKFISCIKWLHDNIIGESTCNRLVRDNIESSMKDIESGEIVLLGFEGPKIIVSDRNSLLDRLNSEGAKDPSRSLQGFMPLIKLASNKSPEKSGIKEILGKNLYYISADLYPSISAHVRRMNTTSFEDVPQFSPFKCVDCEKY